MKVGYHFLHGFKKPHLTNYFSYTDGEKKDTDIELDEEREVYKDPNGFKIITIYNNKKKTRQEEIVWASASAKFYQTMSKAQANYTIKSIGVVCNTKLRNAYLAKKQVRPNASN